MSVATTRKSLLPLRLQPPGLVGQKPTLPMPSVADESNKTPLSVGNRVLVNGLKSGTIRYIGTVQFASGVFCGIELDQADGKHDGQVNDIQYFKCAPNHGVFVPRDKVVLAARARASSSQRPVSRLKPPTMTRSITLSAAINKIEHTKPVQLPDIVPNNIIQPVTQDDSINTMNPEPIISTEAIKDEPMNIIEPKVEILPIPVEEPVETIEADFTDSVSLILHKLQQEQKLETCASSIIISEEDEEDDDEDLETQSLVESTISERMDEKHRLSVSSSIHQSNESTKFVQTDLSFSINDNVTMTKIDPATKTSINKDKREIANTNQRKPIIQPVKKIIERKPQNPPMNNNTIKKPAPPVTPRKTSTLISKPTPINKTQLNTAKSITSLTSQSKLSLSLSSSTSLNSSQSDLLSANKASKISQTDDLNLTKTILDKNLIESRNNLNALEQQLTIQKNLNESQHRKYEHLLRQFDLIHILAEYLINENDRMKTLHGIQLSRIQTIKRKFKTSIENLFTNHKNDLSVLSKQNENQIENFKKTHEQQLNDYQKKIDELIQEKSQLASHCSILQEKVDGFVTEMANSEHSDLLLCHVETLEKDRTSLQTVLEFKNREITQLRTKVQEQQLQLDDEKMLRRRIDMAENRNQDLEYLLREKQLTEKAALVERDQLKEQVAQLERDNYQLKFQNETLQYRLCEKSMTVSMLMDNSPEIETKPTIVLVPKQKVRVRSFSLTSLQIQLNENRRLVCSLTSLNTTNDR